MPIHSEIGIKLNMVLILVKEKRKLMKKQKSKNNLNIFKEKLLQEVKIEKLNPNLKINFHNRDS